MLTAMGIWADILEAGGAQTTGWFGKYGK